MEIQDSVAQRLPQPRRRGSKIGYTVDPFRRRRVWFDSGLEECALYVLATHLETLDLREQQKATYFLGGKERHHYFDFLQIKASQRIAIAVKYEEEVDDELRDTLHLIKEQLGDNFADEYRILTEKDLSLVQIENAREIFSCASDYDLEGQAVVTETLRSLPSEVQLAEIGSASRLGLRGQRAATALIQKGTLKLTPNLPLDAFAVLYNRAFSAGGVNPFLTAGR